MSCTKRVCVIKLRSLKGVKKRTWQEDIVEEDEKVMKLEKLKWSGDCLKYIVEKRMSFSSCDIKSGGIFRLVSRDTKSEVKLVSIYLVILL